MQTTHHQPRNGSCAERSRQHRNIPTCPAANAIRRTPHKHSHNLQRYATRDVIPYACLTYMIYKIQRPARNSNVSFSNVGMFNPERHTGSTCCAPKTRLFNWAHSVTTSRTAANLKYYRCRRGKKKSMGSLRAACHVFRDYLRENSFSFGWIAMLG